MWPDFCSALIVGRLAPLGLHDTRFRSVPVSCGPRAGADASSPRHETHRNVANSRSLKSWKGLRLNPGRACVARRARSCTRRRRPRPWRCRTSRRPCRPREACRIPRPWWCTRGRCTARHGRNGARDRPCRHARRPMTSPVPAPAAAAPGVHGGGARPAGDHAGEHVGGERRVAERAVGHAHVGDVGHVRPVRRLRLEPAFHEVGPAARALRRSGGDGRPAADSRFPHDVRHLAAADPG